jgi:hypothetical protein
MKVTEETKATAQRALDYFTAHPERHVQSAWFQHLGDDNDNLRYDTENGWERLNPAEPGKEVNLCNTTMCVAGLVQWQSQGYIDAQTVDDVAASLLGLNDEEQEMLFLWTSDQDAIDCLIAIANGDQNKLDAILGDYTDELDS